MSVLEQGLISNGSKLAYSVGSPISWVHIGEMLTIGDLKVSRAKVDRTVHSQNIYTRSLPGMAAVADMAIEVLGQPDETGTQGAAQAALRALVVAGTTIYWRLEVPTDRAQDEYKGFNWSGYVSDWDLVIGAPGTRVSLKLNIVYDSDSIVETAAGASEIT